MDSKGFVTVCFSDLTGQLRGHGVPPGGLSELYRDGLPWPRDLVAVTAFGDAVDMPWNGVGELRLVPDNHAEVSIDLGAAGQAGSFVLASVCTSDRNDWAGCTRSFLQSTLNRMKSEFGLDVSCSYEHQFTLTAAGESTTGAAGAAASVNALRRESRFAGLLAALLEKSQVELVRFGAGAHAGQFVATTKPKFGVAAGDAAIIFRQLAYATAEHLGQRCSFAPVGAGMTGRNGLTLHLDLFDEGDQVTYDSTAPDGVSATFGSFLAGVARHLPALMAITQPSVVPPRQGLEARAPAAPTPISVNPALRTASPSARAYSLAFAAADATACPYLQLGALVCAGLQGLREGLPAPNGSLSAGPAAMPATTGDALAALGADDVYKKLFPDSLVDAYIRVKQAELQTAAKLSHAELCEWSQQIY